MKVDPTRFHDHLDACRQCREHPFNLCATGARLLPLCVEPETTTTEQRTDSKGTKP